ncbi:MAG: TetR/AcrR family transcriptional regulator [Actinomycetota bacterium]|nr:TetR/AcrR family transcriptional regulator [Actinomycetota bacterium]
MARPKIHDDALRDRLLDSAARLVARDGARALALRTLAAEAGTSTSAIYSLFGGKPDLFAALHKAAFADFSASQHAVGNSGDPQADLMVLAETYRDWALQHPQLYAVMFGGALTPALPADFDCPYAAESMRPLQQAAGRLIETGATSAAATVDAISVSLWATVHGFVSLELAQVLVPDSAPQHAYRVTCRVAIDGWLARRRPVR